MIDTHTHLYANEFDADRTQVIDMALKKGVSHFYLPAINSESHQKMLDLESQYPNQIFAMMGLHPCYVKNETYLEELAIVQNYLQEREFCAIGEIGIDLHWDQSTLELQILAFEQQIDWAIALNKPIVIHARQSIPQILEILNRKKHPNLRGILHCFSGTLEQAKQAISLQFFLGIGGVVTYKNGGISGFLKEIPLENIVLETDSPYLAPVPYRGQRNESAFLVEVLGKLGDIYCLEASEIDRITSQNAKKIFGLL